MVKRHFRADKSCDCDNVRMIIRGEGCVPQMLSVGQGRRLGRLDKPVDDELSFVVIKREAGFEITREETRRFLASFVSRDTAPQVEVSGAYAR